MLDWQTAWDGAQGVLRGFEGQLDGFGRGCGCTAELVEHVGICASCIRKYIQSSPRACAGRHSPARTRYVLMISQKISGVRALRSRYFLAAQTGASPESRVISRLSTQNRQTLYSREGRTRGRFWFGVATLFVTVLLIAWGGFVTSIDAGLAVPDWPSSFNSYDPFNPWPEWWTLTPVLAEHGHRLLGALVGMLTVVLGIWTWLADNRKWVRYLGVIAILLVVVQGTLGGLRVIWVSLDLAVVHACVAQIFFALLASLTLFNSGTWLALRSDATPAASSRMKARPDPILAAGTAVAIFLQIFLGALLRHPGTGIDPVLVTVHIAGAAVVVFLTVLLYLSLRRRGVPRSLLRLGTILLGTVVVQVALGLTAYLVLLDERGMLTPSNVQVIVNSAHLVVGGLVFASSVCLALLVFRLRQDRLPAGSSLSASIELTPA